MSEDVKELYQRFEEKKGRECKDKQMWQEAFNLHKQYMKGKKGYCGTSIGCGGCRNCVWQWLRQEGRT